MEEKKTARIPDGFDPNGPGIANGSYFGLPFAPEESSLVLIPVPWDVTVSYREGTALGPGAILDASLQVDLYDVHCPGAWKQGIGTAELDDTWPLRSRMLREEARRVIEHWETGGSPDSESLRRRLRRVNEGAERLEAEVYAEACRWLDAGKTVGVVGGEHSVPLGLIRAVAERHPGLGILHVDAHADLREAYEGFVRSHASIMFNALREAPSLASLVQVGVRYFCDEEAARDDVRRTGAVGLEVRRRKLAFPLRTDRRPVAAASVRELRHRRPDPAVLPPYGNARARRADFRRGGLSVVARRGVRAPDRRVRLVRSGSGSFRR